MVLTTKEKAHIEIVENRISDRFMKKRDDGVFVFNRYNPKSGNVNYNHYIIKECEICEKELFTRRSGGSGVHLNCHLTSVRGLK